MGEDLNPEKRHSRDTRDDGTVTLCTLRAAIVLSHDCRADFGRPLTKKVMSRSHDGPGVTAPSRTNIVPFTGVWNPPLSVTPPPLKKSPNTGGDDAFGRRIFIHHQCWEVLPFCRFQRQRCIKILCPKDPGFLYTAGAENGKRAAPPSTGGV